jgi:hypothetical protein
MGMPLLTLVMNIILMALLGAMIFYAKRLSDNISIFRNSREEMQNLIKSLSKSIDKAEAAIKSMRRETDTSADDLHFMITKAKALSEELQFVQESGERLANRLEKARDEASSSVVTSHNKQFEETKLRAPERPKADKKKPAPPRPMFNIIDRDQQGGDDLYAYIEDDNDIPDNLKSQAEKDLALALQRQQNSKKG